MKSGARPPFWPGASAAALAFLFFSPILGSSLNNWEDLSDVFANSHLALRGWPLLRWCLTSQFNSSFEPFGWLALALMRAKFGASAFAFHLTCVVLHSAAAALAALIAWRLLALTRPSRAPDQREAAAAAFAAVLFALHPLQVESAAMASCVAHLLGLTLGLGAVAAFLWNKNRIAFALFAAAALTRWMALPLAAGLLFLAWYPLPQPRRAARRAIPFLAAAAAAAGAAFWSKRAFGFALSPGAFAAWARAWTQFAGHWISPTGLSPFYELGPGRAPFGWTATQCVLLIAAVSGVAYLARRKLPALLPAWLFCGLCFLPPSLMSSDGTFFAHDRFAYLPCLALALAASGGARRLLESPRWRGAGAALSILLGLALGAASIRQELFWRDSETLWRHALVVDPFEPMAYNRLAQAEIEELRRPCEAAAEAALQYRLDPAPESAAFARAARAWCAADRAARQ